MRLHEVVKMFNHGTHLLTVQIFFWVLNTNDVVIEHFFHWTPVTSLPAWAPTTMGYWLLDPPPELFVPEIYQY